MGVATINSDIDVEGLDNLAFTADTPQTKRETETSSETPNSIKIFEKKELKGNLVGNKIEEFWSGINNKIKDNTKVLKIAGIVFLAIFYNSYFIAAIHYGATEVEGSLDYCTDVGFLVILTVMVYIGFIYFFLIKPYFPRAILKNFKRVLVDLRSKIPDSIFYALSYTVVPFIICIFVIADTWYEPQRLYSALGLFILVLLGFLFSKHPGYVFWRHVVWGLCLQFVFGAIILRWQVGKNVFDCIGRKVAAFLEFTDSGSEFVFGYLVSRQPFIAPLVNGTANEVAQQINLNKAIPPVFMFKVLSIIYFFNFCVSMLFYLGTMQWIVVKLGWLLQVTVGTTACESLNASANIFLGQSEAPLMIKPYLPDMTRSELHAVMTGGFATVAGTVLAAYINFGVSASHLLTASVMSAPAALAFAKLFYPETKKSKTTSANIIFPKSEDSNILDAASNGAVQSVILVGNIAASLVAVLAFVAFMNSLLGWFGGLVGAPYISFQYILGLVFYPLSFLMGIDCTPVAPCCGEGSCPDGFYCDQCQAVAVLVGLKTIVNEFVAYEKLPGMVASGMLSARSEAIVTFALCGFSNPASIGIQIASLSYMAPSRRGDISQVAFRAFIAGSCACFLTACIAGTLIKESSLVQ